MSSSQPTGTAAPNSSSEDGSKPKPRRFLPQPVETSTKSSKTARQLSPEKKEVAPKTRRFAPQPIEHSAKSSRNNTDSQDEAPKPRRFAPQAIEHSARSSRSNTDSQDETPKPRRFAPQIVEQSRRSSRDSLGKPGHIRFSPQPVETTHHSNRKHRDQQNDAVEPETRSARKFAPELVDTAKRSTRGEHAEHQHANGHNQAHEATEVNSGTSGVDEDGHLCPCDSDAARRPVSPFDGSPSPRLAALTQQRSHSFRLPDLDTIESSESEPENGPSSRSSSSERGSPITASDSSYNGRRKHAARMRESIDESFTHYLLQLEAEKHQQRLQEQALAAFPNSDFHEPISHFVNDEEDSDDMEIDDRPVTWSAFDEEEILHSIQRRESTAVPWEQLELQRHAEKKEQERSANKSATKQTSQSPWWNPVAGGLTMYQQDPEITSMRDRARPPMLGRDLVFPRCPSPERARFDTTQRSGTISSIGSLDGDNKAAEGGLWQGAKKADVSLPSSENSKPSPKSSIKGLWGGHCVDTNTSNNAPSSTLSPPPGPTGLMTPQVEHATNPFEQSFAFTGGNSARPTAVSHAVRTPPTPPSDKGVSSIDTVMAGADASASSGATAADLDAMYPDAFITQVFNYLSLGYPSLARPFDAELSKISRIPIAALRKDDIKARASPRGYIRLGPDFEGGDEHVGKGGSGDDDELDYEHATCVRWVALRLYVREWAKQERDMVPFEAAGGNWGTGARRGSWAI